MMYDEDLFETFTEDVEDFGLVSEYLAPSPAIPPGCNRLTTAAEVAIAPFRYICSVTLNEANRVTGGSGTLIGFRTVLCAAHTVFDAPRPRDLKVHFGIPDFSKTPLRFSIASSVVEAIHIFPKFTDLGLTGTASDVAILKLKTSMRPTVKGFWGKSPRPSFDSRGSRIGSLPGWRPGTFKVNFGGYPQSFLGSQFHCYTPTLPSIAGASILSLRSNALAGLSGGPVWVTRHASLGGRHLCGMIVSLDSPSGEIDAVHFTKPENLDVMKFIKHHARSARFSFSV